MSGIGHRYIRTYDGSTDDAWLRYTCAHCGSIVMGFVIASYPHNSPPTIKWLQCPNCKGGSVLVGEKIHPGSAFGPQIEGLPQPISDAYQEARNCMSVNAFSACELICRKILMHVAVEKGAKAGDTFANYISFLEQKGFVTPPMKGWVELIKDHGNKATHRLEAPDKERAESTLMFTAELLRLIYEMDHISKRYTAKSNSSKVVV